MSVISRADCVATAAVLAAIAALQRTIKTRRAEKYKAEDLAAVVLKRLQDQVSFQEPFRPSWY